MFYNIITTNTHWNNQQATTPYGDTNNDPSAGSPTETLLRLHLPLNGKIYTTSLNNHQSVKTDITKIQSVHRTIQSVGATGGVYKGQGRNQRKLMTCIY